MPGLALSEPLTLYTFRVLGFNSDNNAGLCPEAMQAILDANHGHRPAYGDDDHTTAAVGEFRRIFGADTAVWFVATGTAANTLAIASLEAMLADAAAIAGR